MDSLLEKRQAPTRLPTETHRVTQSTHFSAARTPGDQWPQCAIHAAVLGDFEGLFVGERPKTAHCGATAPPAKDLPGPHSSLQGGRSLILHCATDPHVETPSDKLTCLHS